MTRPHRDAEAIAGIRLGGRGEIELLPKQMLKDFAKRIPSGVTNNQYEQLAGWFLKVEHRP